MRRRFADLPLWVFELDELADHVYSVTATNRRGQSFSRQGPDINELFEECKLIAEHPEVLTPGAIVH